MRYGSVCSGIEAASIAWESLGFKPAWFSEIEPFPSAVLAHHWPQVQNLGDMTMIAERILSEEVEAPDILVGGTPCVAFSVAGKRKSLSDDRGNLTLKFTELADAIDTIRIKNGQQPVIVVWENVPGVLSTKDNAFGCFLGKLSHSGCELQPSGKRWTNAGSVLGKRQITWRTLDAQYFGVPQRRRRVFLVASARERFNTAEILFESKSVPGDFEKSGEKRQRNTDISPTITASGGGISRPGGAGAELGFYVPTVAKTLTAQADKQDVGMETFIAYCVAGNTIGRTDSNGGNSTGFQEDISYTLTTNDIHAVCIQSAAIGRDGSNDQVRSLFKNELSFALTASDKHAVSTQYGVRRLTPIECERLQGFPDNHTLVPYRNNIATDTPRYKAIGNSIAVPVMKWIGKRILKGLNK